MSNTDQAQEPSMEEILASIRKIISDDENDEATASDDSDVVSDGVETEAASEEVAQAIADVAQQEDQVAEPEPEPDMMAEAMAEEVMADADMGVEDSSADAEAFAEIVEEEAPVSEAPVSVEEEDEVLELTEEVDVSEIAGLFQEDGSSEFESDEEDGSVTEAEAAVSIVDEEALDPAEMIVTGEEEVVFFEEEETPAVVEEEEPVISEPEPVPEPVEEIAATESLFSTQTDDSVSTAFGSLENLVLSTQSRTIEDLLQTMLRPMLREWLDGNLPPLVERLVRDEIERVSRGRR